MSYLNSPLLWLILGGIGVAVPVIIHLLHQRHRRREQLVDPLRVRDVQHLPRLQDAPAPESCVGTPSSHSEYTATNEEQYEVPCIV